MHFHFIVLEAFRQHYNHCPTRNEDNAMCTKYEDYNVKLGANRGRERAVHGVSRGTRSAGSGSGRRGEDKHIPVSRTYSGAGRDYMCLKAASRL